MIYWLLIILGLIFLCIFVVKSLILTPDEKERFYRFQKYRRPSMRIVGRGTLTMDIEDARKAAIEIRGESDKRF